MYKWININGTVLPSYGLIILAAILFSNLIAHRVAKIRKLNYDTLFIFELYGGIGSYIGAKALYWIQNGILPAGAKIGYSMYGGMVIGILLAFVASKVHKLPFALYMRNFIFLIPFVHGIWKIACFCAGCCYGIKYTGIGAVIFPLGVNRLSGEKVFPVQIVEAVLLFICMLYYYNKGKHETEKSLISEYMICYCLIRFVVEFFRYHEYHTFLSVAQIDSITIIAFVFVLRYVKKLSRRSYNE